MIQALRKTLALKDFKRVRDPLRRGKMALMIRLQATLGLALWTLLTISGVVAAQSVQPHVFFARQIWPGNDKPVEDAAMVVVDGKITSVGPRDSMSIPPGAVVHDLGNQTIIPGLIAAHSNLAGTQAEERTLTPQIRALDGFDFYADRDELLEVGLTTAHVAPSDSRLLPGVGGVVQLAGEDMLSRILSEQESLQVVLTESARKPPRIYEPPVGPVSDDRPLTATRPQLATLTATMAGLRQILKRATNEQTFVSTGQDEVIEEVARLIRAKKPLRITARTTPEIRGAVSLAREFDLAIVLNGCVDLKPFESVFAGWKPHVRGVILPGVTPGKITNPSLEQIENQGDPAESARQLLDAGIPVAIQVATDADLKQLMFVAGSFLRGDLTTEEVLSAITFTPASVMGVDKEVGCLAPGRRADFVVLSDPPFQLHSRVQATYAAGKPVFDRQRKPATTVVRADRVYLGDGHYLDQASVVVKGRTVRGVGPSVSSPMDADIKTFKGAVIVPGFVDMGTGLGLGGPLRGTVTLSTKLGEQLYADDPAIEFARQNGVTTALLGIGSSGKASPVVAFKLGPDARVIGDPVAVRFKMTGDAAAGEAANEKLLKAGKAYADSWTKYEKELVEYEAKVKERAAKAKTSSAAKKETKGEEKKPSTDKEKSDADKKDADKKDPEKKDPDKKEPEKKETGDKKEDDSKEKPKTEKKKVLPDPITGTWEGTIDMERVPEQLRAFKFELELNEDGTISGSVEIFRQSTDIVSGTYDRASKELSIVIARRGNEIEILGRLDDAGGFSGSIELGRMGTVELTAERTVDKSKKPEPEPEKETPEKKDPDKKEVKKDKPDSGKDEDGKEPEKKNPADDKKEATKDDKKEVDKKSDAKTDSEKKPAADAKEQKQEPELKPPKKPRLSDALEPYRALFARKIPAMVEARSLTSIKASAELFSKQYKLRTVIIGADGLARQPDLLSGFEVSVCAGPQLSVAVDKQPNANLPQVLSNERIPFGFQSEGTTGVGQLPAAVQFAVSQGLSTTDALQGLTETPARILSEDVKFGKITAGHDADLVVLSGPPFEFSTKVLAVMVDGIWVYEREENE